jgi:GMP synthase-like glutamine amidotransferase
MRVVWSGREEMRTVLSAKEKDLRGMASHASENCSKGTTSRAADLEKKEDVSGVKTLCELHGERRKKIPKAFLVFQREERGTHSALEKRDTASRLVLFHEEQRRRRRWKRAFIRRNISICNG